MSNLWPQPSKSPNVQTPSEAGGISVGSIPAYTDPLRFYGRLLDSQFTQQLQGGPVRTLRAFSVRAAPERNKLYGIIGSHLVSWNLDRLFVRLAANEQMQPINRFNGVAESWLQPDATFYPEQAWAGEIDKTDGDRRTFALDYDDRGYVYVGCDPGGWGILQESLFSMHHHIPQSGDAGANGQVIVSKDGGRYLLTVAANAGASADVFDVTNVASPVKVGSAPIPSDPRAAPIPSTLSVKYIVGPFAHAYGNYTVVYGVESFQAGTDWTGTLNARMFKGGVAIPLLTPKGEQFFAMLYASRLAALDGYAQYVGSAGDVPTPGPNFSSAINDVAIVGRADGVYAFFAVGAFLDVFRIDSSGSQPPAQPPSGGGVDISGAVAQLSAAQTAIGHAIMLLGTAQPPTQPPVVQPPVIVPPTQPPVSQPPQPSQPGPVVGSPCDRSTVLPDGYACIGGKVVKL